MKVPPEGNEVRPRNTPTTKRETPPDHRLRTPLTSEEPDRNIDHSYHSREVSCMFGYSLECSSNTHSSYYKCADLNRWPKEP